MIPVEVTSRHAASIASVNNAVRVEHRYDLEDEAGPQGDRRRVRGGEEVQQTLTGGDGMV